MDAIEDIEDALSIDIPATDSFRIEDCRRLTGPGLLWDSPGAVVQVELGLEFSTITLIDTWNSHARRTLDAVGWQAEKITSRAYDGGVNLAISAPMDQLYSAVFVAQTAMHFCAAEILGTPSGDFDAMIKDLLDVMIREANPNLIALAIAAHSHNIDVLADDDFVSIGHGAGSQTWPIHDIPDIANVPWEKLHNVPLAMITGTNGKTTTTRLCAAIAQASGKVSGLTSTDFVSVGKDVLDQGDYSGPGGARLLLRDQRLEIGILEVARGGILRRGLPTRGVHAAVVTNVAADHLGQYGVNTVPELTRAKFAVHRSLSPDGVLILNADDHFVVAESSVTDANICWFSLDPNSLQINEALALSQPCAWLEGGELKHFDGAQTSNIIPAIEIPIAMLGAAKYNLSNCLAAICVAKSLGIDNGAIVEGLRQFKNNPDDNPGRLNEFEHNSARIFVDFAHNPHSVSAVAETISGIPAKRRFIMLSHAGDRSDQDIVDVTTTALTMSPDCVVAVELADYLRGRQLGEVSKIIKTTVLAQDYGEDQIVMRDSPLKGVEYILTQLQPDDVALLLVLSERDEVFNLLRKS